MVQRGLGPRRAGHLRARLRRGARGAGARLDGHAGRCADRRGTGRSAVFSAAGLPGRLFDLGRRVPLVRTVLSLSPGLRGTFGAADDLAAQAGVGVTTLTGTPTTLVARGLAAGDESLSRLVTLVGRVDDAVPGSIRVQVLDALSTGVAGSWGALQYSLVVQSGYSALDDFVLEPRQEARDADVRAQTVERWSQPLLQAR